MKQVVHGRFMWSVMSQSVVVLLLTGWQTVSAGGPGIAGREARTAAAASQFTDRLIVKYRDGSRATVQADFSSMAQVHASVNRQGAQMRVLRRTASDAMVMKLDRRVSLEAAKHMANEIMAGDPDVVYAEPDRLLKPLFTPNDSYYNEQWQYFEATGGINLPKAWDKSTGAGIVVAVVDSGYRPHVDLAANILPGYDFIQDLATAKDGDGRDSDAKDPGNAEAVGECEPGSPAVGSDWHGTHVAGIVAAVANNRRGVAGVAFNAKVLPVRVMGPCGGYMSDMADGIVWAAGGKISGVPINANPARVINISMGGEDACSKLEQDAIDRARSRGAVVIVAAGNDGINNANKQVPGNCKGVINVAASNRSGRLATYSSYGSSVDVAAPGGDLSGVAANDVLSTVNAGQAGPGADAYAAYAGTSMAAPHVAGIVALMLSKKSSLSPDQVERLLKGSTRPFAAACNDCGTGIVDANAAVDAAAASSGGSTVTTLAEVESNNTGSTAQSIVPNPALVNGSLSSTTDMDYYRLTLAAGDKLTAKLTPPSGANYDLYLYNSSGTLVASSTQGAGAADSATYANSGSAASSVYVLVRHRSGSASSYTLNLSH